MDPAEMLRRGYTRETAIRRDAAGRWFDGNEPITHPNLVRSFEGWIDKAEDGRFCLSNDINWAYIEVLGPPYFVKSLREAVGSLQLRLSGDRMEALDPSTLRLSEEGHLWCDVREGRVPARFDSHAATQLAEYLHESDEGVYLKALGWPPRLVPVVSDPMKALNETA